MDDWWVASYGSEGGATISQVTDSPEVELGRTQLGRLLHIADVPARFFKELNMRKFSIQSLPAALALSAVLVATPFAVHAQLGVGAGQGLGVGVGVRDGVNANIDADVRSKADVNGNTDSNANTGANATVDTNMQGSSNARGNVDRAANQSQRAAKRGANATGNTVNRVDSGIQNTAPGGLTGEAAANVQGSGTVRGQ